jgi:hypothetical protein
VRCDTREVRYPSRGEAGGHGRAADLSTRLRVVRDAYSDAQHDLDTVLTRPTLFDPADPATADFLRALRVCDRLPTDQGAVVASWTADSAVGSAEVAWQRARSEADRVKLSRFRPLERRRVRRARRLLRKAGSDRGSVPLRQGYFHRAETLLSGLVTLPDALRADILEVVRTPSRVDGPVGEPGSTWV